MTFSAGIGSLIALLLGFFTGGFFVPVLPHALFETAETSGFSVLEDAGASGAYTTSTEGVFYRGEPVEGADPDTFTVIDPYYAKDATHVYFNLEPVSPSSTVAVLKGADPRTFDLCGSEYDRDDCAKDETHIYVLGKVVPGADPATFEALDSYYGKDAKHVYYAGAAISLADAASFTLVAGKSGYDAQDSQRMYVKGKVVLQ